MTFGECSYTFLEVNLQGWVYLAFSSPSAPSPVFLCANAPINQFSNLLILELRQTRF
jgi:hypothetical protein